MSSSDDELPYEKILGMKKTENRSYEYLVKYKGKSYQKLEWVQDSKIRRFPEGQNFIARANRTGIKTEPPFYDPEYEIIDKIVAENNNKFLVKWKKLGYDQLTWETEVSQLEIDRYRDLSLETLPTLDESMQRTFQFPQQTNCALSSHELITYNYLKSQILSESSINITDKYCFRSIRAISAIISDLLLCPQEKGPFLIISAYDEIELFNVALHELSFRNHPVCYAGSKDSKSKMNELDMIFAPHVLKYNVMITTPDMFVSELEYFKNISWRLLIVNDNNNTINRRHYKEMEKLELYKKVKLEYQSLSTTLPGINKIVEDCSTKEIKQLLTEEEQAAADRLKNVVDPIMQGQHKRGATNCKNFTVNCPINNIQSLAIQRAIEENKENITQNNFYYLAQKIFRCINHPLIAYGDIDVDNVSSSTKMQVLLEMIGRSIDEGKSIVVISQFITFIDILEDILRQMNISWRRFTRGDASAENGSEVFIEGEISVFLFDSRLSREIDIPLHIIDTAVLIDEPQTVWMNILRTHREGRISVSKVSEIYRLEASDLFEDKLFAICNDYNSPQMANIEQICRKAAITAMVFQPIPTPDQLLNLASLESAKASFKGDDGFDIKEFWQILFNEEDNSFKFDPPQLDLLANKPPNKKWTVADREILMRWIRRVGSNRSKDLIKLSRLNYTPEEITLATKAIIRETLKLAQSLAAFPVARSLLSQDTDEDIKAQKSFMNEKPFSDLLYIDKLKNDAIPFLRHLECLFYICSLFEKNPEGWMQIPPLKLAGASPAQIWGENMDKALLYVNYKYGFGVYDHVADSNIDLVPILGDGQQITDHIKLDERAQRLSDSAKRLQLSDDKVIESLVQLNYEGWKPEEMSRVIQFVLKYGLTTPDGEKNYDIIKEQTNCDHTVTEIQEYIDFVLAACENPQQIVGNMIYNTGQKVLQRISAMQKLHAMLKELDETTGPIFFENAPKWRQAPPQWTPELEYLFFLEVAKNGFGELNTIFTTERFKNVFEKEPPSFMTNDHSVAKRLEALDQFRNSASKPLDKKKPKTEKHKRSESAIAPKPVTVSGLAELEDGEIEYPIMITQSSFVLNIGHVVYDRPGWHTARYIYPAGFKTVKQFASVKNPEERVNWISEICDTGKKNPVFKVYMEDDPKVCFIADSPSSPWVNVLKAVSEAKKSKTKTNSISGPDAFLLTAPVVTYLIQNLPNANKCTNYVFKEIKGAPAKPVKIAKSENNDDGVVHTEVAEGETEIGSKSPSRPSRRITLRSKHGEDSLDDLSDIGIAATIPKRVHKKVQRFSSSDYDDLEEDLDDKEMEQYDDDDRDADISDDLDDEDDYE